MNSCQGARIALSLSTSPNLCLDLWKGFSDPISINVQSAEDSPNGEPPPFLEYLATCFDWYPIPATWALSSGLLAIRDESGTIIKLPKELLPDQFVNPAVQYLRGLRVNKHKLDRVPRRLLKELRTKLRPGRSYRLGFREKTFPMQALRQSPDSERLRPITDRHWPLVMTDINRPGIHWVQAMCDMSSHGVPFEVVAGTPVPRFEAALSVSQTVRGQGPHPDKPQCSIYVKITSIDKRPVKVRMPEPKFELVPHCGLADWLKVYPAAKSYGSNLLFQCSIGPRLKWQKDNGAIQDTCPSGALDFHQGTSYTVSCSLPDWLSDPRLLERCSPGIALEAKIIADSSGFSTWRYASDDDDDVEHDDDSHAGKAAAAPYDQWPSSHGHIEFEPVLDRWEELERMLEHERLLGKLPFELRRIIYDYVKFAEDVAVKSIIIRGEEEK
ncbi:MAG: hypothetical protein Q9223_003973 [Gallowayella weberi]